MKKICSKCKSIKNFIEFPKRKKSKDGLNSWCKNCHSIWSKNNPEKKKEYRKKNYLKHKEKINEHKKIYYQTNKRKINKKTAIYIKNKCKNNRHFYIKRCVSSLMRLRLKKRLLSKNGKSIWDFFPYTVDALKQHIEKQFKDDMSWDNYGFYGWHIDHIIPDCRFNYTSIKDKEFQKCWALNNLQPLWAEENWKKNK